MKAGETNLEVGQSVRLQNIKGEDKRLNGLTGSVTHPFAFGETGPGWVGIWLDAGQVSAPWGGQCNVMESECKAIEPTLPATTTQEKKTVKMIISVDIETSKPMEEVKKALERGIYRGLDTPPYMIAQPAYVKINYCLER